MLSEFKDLRQYPDEDRRRLFTDKDFSLYVWYREGRLSGFELCYDKQAEEKALLWTVDHGFSWHTVEDGETEPYSMKASAILTSPQAALAPNLIEDFGRAAGDLEPEIRDLVLEKLGQSTK